MYKLWRRATVQKKLNDTFVSSAESNLIPARCTHIPTRVYVAPATRNYFCESLWSEIHTDFFRLRVAPVFFILIFPSLIFSTAGISPSSAGNWCKISMCPTVGNWEYYKYLKIMDIASVQWKKKQIKIRNKLNFSFSCISYWIIRIIWFFKE